MGLRALVTSRINVHLEMTRSHGWFVEAMERQQVRLFEVGASVGLQPSAGHRDTMRTSLLVGLYTSHLK